MNKKAKLKFKFLYIFLGLLPLTFTGCVKQSDCDCGLTGKFVYFDEPYYPGPQYYKPDTKIVAHFIQDTRVYHIYGYVPNKYRSQDTLDVKVCLEVLQFPEYQYTHGMWIPTYSLKCIEKIDY